MTRGERARVRALLDGAVMPVHRDDLDTPVDLMVHLAHEGASGEIVIAGPSLEAHVYLYGGRVAWATTSGAPNALLRHLLEHCDIDRAAVSLVVEECRRTRKRFGETLIEWGVATADQVRGALRAQILDTIECVADFPAARAMFLPRDIEYSDELTFDIAEVCERATGRRERDTDLERELADALPQAVWVETAVADPAATGDTRAAFLRSLTASLVDVNAAQVTLRSRVGAVVGRRIGAEPRWLYCAVREPSAVGLAAAVMRHLGGDSQCPDAREHGADVRASADSEDAATSASVRDAFAHTPELLAAGVFDADARPTLALHRDGIDPAALGGRAGRLSGALGASLSRYLEPIDSATEVAYDDISIHVGEADANHFATGLDGERRASLWTTLDATAPVGLGWALLTTLRRQLTAART